MICVKCNVDSPDGARFCMSCGSALSNACPNCATDLPEGARKQIADATEFVETREMHHFYPVIAMAAAQLAGAAGDVATALTHMERMERTAGEMNMRPFVWQAKAGIAGMLDATGRPAEAEAKRQEARAVIEEIGELFTDERLKSIYLENAGAAVPEPV